MILKYGKQWHIAILLIIPMVNLQMPFQVFQMPPQMYSYPQQGPSVALPYMPAPAPIAFQILEIQEVRSTTTTTTTTTTPKTTLGSDTLGVDEKTIGIAIPIAFPAPVQFAIPAYAPPASCMRRPRPNNCPVCPPCMCSPCTPAFFSYCSPCHKKCRCRNGNDAPVPMLRTAPNPVNGPAYPMPMPFMGGHPELAVPVHRKQRRTSQRADDDHESIDSYESLDSSDSFSSEWVHLKKRRRNKGKLSIRRRPFYRRTVDTDIYDNNFAKPVLSYVSNDGEVKLEKPLSDDDAKVLMDEQGNQRVQVVTGEDSENRQRVKVISNFENTIPTGDYSVRHQKKRVVLRSGPAQHMLGEGKKELVFKPPIDKKISNLSLSFQIT